MIGKKSFSELVERVGKLYNEMLTNNVKFEELSKTTVETMKSFKRSIEKQDERIEKLQKEHTLTQADLQSKITLLEGRLNSLSESALHAAIEKATKDVLKDRLGKNETAQPEIESPRN